MYRQTFLGVALLAALAGVCPLARAQSTQPIPSMAAWPAPPPVPAAAAHHNALRRAAGAYGNAAANMFTFRRKQAAIQSWLFLAAQTADNISTLEALRGCRTCTEENPLFGKRPSAFRLFAITAPIVETEIALGWKANESMAGSKWSWTTWIAPGASAAVHGWAASHNLGILAQCRAAALAACE